MVIGDCTDVNLECRTGFDMDGRTGHSQLKSAECIVILNTRITVLHVLYYTTVLH